MTLLCGSDHDLKRDVFFIPVSLLDGSESKIDGPACGVFLAPVSLPCCKLNDPVLFTPVAALLGGSDCDLSVTFDVRSSLFQWVDDLQTLT